MSEAGIRAAIKTIMEGVAGIGLVYDYERYLSNEAAFKSVLVTGGVLHYWTISRQSTRSQRLTNKQTLERHSFKIRGYRALADATATERTFQALVEAIKAAFRTNYTVNGTAEDAGPLQVDNVAPAELGKVLVHFAELTLEAQELV